MGIKETSRRYYLEHKAILNEKQKVYRATLPEERKQKMRERYVLFRKQKILSGICCHCGNNPIALKTICLPCSEKIKIRSKLDREKFRRMVYEHYGHKCACCGESKPSMMAIDHIHGDGNKFRKTINSGLLYRWIVKNDYPKNLQILCANCNQSKSILGQCAHKLP